MRIANCCFCKEPIYESSNWNITELYDFHHIKCGNKERERLIVREYEMRETSKELKKLLK